MREMVEAVAVQMVAELARGTEAGTTEAAGPSVGELETAPAVALVAAAMVHRTPAQRFEVWPKYPERSSQEHQAWRDSHQRWK